MKALPTALAIVLSLVTPAYAGVMDHAHHHMAKPVVASALQKNPAVKAYRAAADVMHRGMDITYTGNADIDFARGMVPHHQGAVDMVSVLHRYGKDEALRDLGKRIIIAQNTEIGIMKRWLETRDNANLKAAENDAVRAYREAMATMHKAMDIRYTGNADVDFVNGMIPHHQGAIDMAWVILKHGRDAELRDIAYDVIRSQNQEIAFMKEWLKKRP